MPLVFAYLRTLIHFKWLKSHRKPKHINLHCIKDCYFWLLNSFWMAGQPASKSKIIPEAMGLICSKQTRLQSPENTSTQFIMQTLCRSPQLILIVCRFKKIRQSKADIDSSEGK